MSNQVYTPQDIDEILADARRFCSSDPESISSHLMRIIEQLRAENAKLIADRTERCEDCDCKDFPATGMRHEGCDGAFCYHGYCQECGAMLLEEPAHA